MCSTILICLNSHACVSIHFQSCCRSVPCFIDDRDCTALFFLFELWKPCTTDNISRASISSPTSRSSRSALNRQWLHLSPALEWIEKIMLLKLLGAWTVKQCPCIICNYSENGQRMKIRAWCLNSWQQGQLSTLLDNGPIWSVIVMNWFHWVISFFPFEHSRTLRTHTFVEEICPVNLSRLKRLI